MKIACGMAAIASRYSHAEKTVRQLLADDRVTSFSLYCDSTEVIPAWTQRLDERLSVWSPPKECNLIGDAGKTLCMQYDADMYLLLDDDLDYVQEYSDFMAAACSESQPIVTWHGVRFHDKWQYAPSQVSSPYECREVLHFGGKVEEDQQVDLGGTGVMAIHKSVVEDFRGLFAAAPANMLDIHLAVRAAQLGVPITCVKHEESWIRQGTQDNGIYERRNEDPLKNEISVALIKYLLRLKGKL